MPLNDDPMRGNEMKRDPDALVQLLDQLLSMRSRLVDQLAVKITGDKLALLGSIDSAAAATEAEIASRHGDEG